jgi:hypothetical protein
VKFAVPALLAALCFGCVGRPKEAYVEWSPQSSEAGKTEALTLIIESKTDDIPQWVQVYERLGVRGVEELPLYQGAYLFISGNSGGNFGALTQWLAGFTVSHDFAPLVAARVQARFTEESVTFPDQDFGVFFEDAVKGAFDGTYTGAVRDSDFWVRRRYFEEDGVTVDRDVYEFFILVTIDKAALRSQLDALLGAIPLRGSKEQVANITRVRTAFYDTF